MSDVSGGPGWWLASDGKWYPPQEAPLPPPQASPSGWIETDESEDWNHPSYGWAAVVSGVLKVTAWLILIGGIISAITTAVHLHQSSTSGDVVFSTVVGIAAGTIIAAAAIAFFAYVLDLLIGIESNTFVAMQMSVADDDEEEG
jgi:hypothetical protein